MGAYENLQEGKRRFIDVDMPVIRMLGKLQEAMVELHQKGYGHDNFDALDARVKPSESSGHLAFCQGIERRLSMYGSIVIREQVVHAPSADQESYLRRRGFAVYSPPHSVDDVFVGARSSYLVLKVVRENRIDHPEALYLDKNGHELAGMRFTALNTHPLRYFTDCLIGDLLFGFLTNPNIAEREPLPASGKKIKRIPIWVPGGEERFLQVADYLVKVYGGEFVTPRQEPVAASHQ